MSQRAAETLKEDLAALGPQKVSDVEGAQRQIATVMKRLQEEGKISLDSAKNKKSFPDFENRGNGRSGGTGLCGLCRGQADGVCLCRSLFGSISTERSPDESGFGRRVKRKARRVLEKEAVHKSRHSWRLLGAKALKKVWAKEERKSKKLRSVRKGCPSSA